MKIKYNLNGFTLVELLIVIALFAIIIGAIAPFYHRWQTKSDLDVVTVVLANTLRRSQSLSQSMEGDSSWGVYTGNNLILLFKGNSSTTRDADFDEVFNIPNMVTASGQYEIVFSKLIGQSSASTTIILKNSTNQFKNININSQGTISY